MSAKSAATAVRLAGSRADADIRVNGIWYTKKASDVRNAESVLEASLEAEMSEHLGYDKHDPVGRTKGNSRNGTRAKKVLTDVGPVDLEVPRDRDGSFEPQLVKKRQRRLSGVDEMVISLTAKVPQHVPALTVNRNCASGLQSIVEAAYRIQSGDADVVVDTGLAWLKSRLGLPSFLYVHTMDPHVPYGPPPPFDRMFEPHPTEDHPARDPRTDYKEPLDRERMVLS